MFCLTRPMAAVLLILGIVLGIAHTAIAADPVRGKQLYENTPGGTASCSNSTCHGPNPDQNRNGVLAAADNPQAIQDAIDANRGGMGMFQGDLSDIDLADLAAYIGNPGAGEGPSASVSPASLSFSSTTVGEPSAASTVTLSNSGSEALSVVSITTSGADFTVSGGTCTAGGSVPAGSSCTLSVQFTPQDEGARAGTLEIAHDAAGSPDAVSLSGTGIAAATAASIALSATSIAFGDQDLGTVSSTHSVTVTNQGDADLTFSALTLGGSHPGDFTRGGTCAVGVAVAPAASCAISFTFSPQAVGARSASLSILTNASNGAQSLALSGTGVGVPEAAVSPLSLDFGSVLVGEHSAVQSVTVRNNGSADLMLSSIATSHLEFGDIGGSCSTSVPVTPAGGCTVSLAFTPTGAGAASATLTIAHDAAGSPLNVALSGVGTLASPVASLSPETLNFLAVVGDTSAAQTATLSNIGSAALNLESLTLAGTAVGDYALSSSSTCAAGAALDPNQSCTAVIRFTPAAEGSRPARLEIAHDAEPSPSTLALAGTGSVEAQGQLSVDQVSLLFAAQPQGSSSAVRTVTVSNSGSASLLLQSLSLGGAGAQDFVLDDSGNCAADLELAVAESCEVAVRFVPTVASGTRAASLAMDAGSAGEATISLSGTALPALTPVLTLNPARLDLGSGVIGEATAAGLVTLSNTGTAELAIESITTSLAAFAPTSDCPASLAPSAECGVAVRFTATVEGLASAELVVTSNAASSPDSAALSATGVAPEAPQMAWSDGAERAYAPTAVGAVAEPQSLTLANTGNVDATIGQIALSGPAAADFSIDSTTTCPSAGVLEAGTQCQIDIAFGPSAAGERSATLTVSSNASGLPSASLTGTGVAAALPALILSPASMVLNLNLSNELQPQVLVIGNEGAGTLIVSAVDAPEALKLLDAEEAGGGTCAPVPFEVAPGGGCTLIVAPAVQEAIDATIRLTSNDASATHSVRVQGYPLGNAGAGGCSIGRPGRPDDPVWALMLAGAAFAFWWRRRQPPRGG